MTARTDRTEADGGSDAARRAWSAMCDLVLDNQRRREVSDAVGLSFARIRAIRRIAYSPMTMGELASTLGIDAPYATLVVDELERQGFVERRPHPTDRRVKLVAVTDQGAAAAAQAETVMGRPPPGLAALPPDQLEVLATMLEAAGATTDRS